MDNIKLTDKAQAIIKASKKVDAGKANKITHNVDQIIDKITDEMLFTTYYNSTGKSLE